MVSTRPEFHLRFLTEVTPPSLRELVRPGWNGLIFKSSEELAGQLIVRFYPLTISPVSVLSIIEPFAGVSSFSNVGNLEIRVYQNARLAITIICPVF